MQNFNDKRHFLKENGVFFRILSRCFDLCDACLPSSPPRLWWNMSSRKVTPTNASNSSPTSPEGNSPTWTMRSRYRRPACVLKRLSLCRRGISTSPASLPPHPSSPGTPTLEICSWGAGIAVLESGPSLASSFLLLYWPNGSVASFISFSAWALRRARGRTSSLCFRGIERNNNLCTQYAGAWSGHDTRTLLAAIPKSVWFNLFLKIVCGKALNHLSVKESV